MDSIGSGNFREQARRDQLTYEQRLNDLSDERDARTEEALAAQQRFNSALEQISAMQSELLASEARRRELGNWHRSDSSHVAPHDERAGTRSCLKHARL